MYPFSEHLFTSVYYTRAFNSQINASFILLKYYKLILKTSFEVNKRILKYKNIAQVKCIVRSHKNRKVVSFNHLNRFYLT